MCQCSCESWNCPEFTASSSCFCSSQGLSSSPSLHCVIAYAHPVSHASVKMHARMRLSLYAVVMVCIMLRLIVSQASWCRCVHPACSRVILRAAAMLRRVFVFRALCTSSDRTADASEKRGMSSRIQPTAALNCHTSPKLRGGDTFISPASLSGSTVMPCLVIFSPQKMVDVSMMPTLPGWQLRWWQHVVCMNSPSISTISSCVFAYSRTSSVIMMRPLCRRHLPSFLCTCLKIIVITRCVYMLEFIAPIATRLNWNTPRSPA